MTPHLRFDIRDPSQVGEARRAALRLANKMEFDEVTRGRVALVVTELGTNLTRHAERGRILLAACEMASGKSVEVLSLDDGPGMADIDSCLRDGYSTSSTPGTGLGAVRRLGDEFSAFSMGGKGTVIAARVRPRATPNSFLPGASSRFAFGAICLAAPGETVCGDGWSFRSEEHKATVMVADGLGHGPAAADAAATALNVFNTSLGGSPSQLLERAHVALRTTRGAAVAVAELDAVAGTVVFSGAGNIAGRLISGVEDRTLLSQHGTIGLQIRRLQDVQYAWPDHAILVLHSDGLISRWNLDDSAALLRCDPLVIAGWLLRDHCRGRDDATVLVARRQ